AIFLLLTTGGDDNGGGAAGTVAVPPVVNKTQAEAEAALTDAGLKFEINERDNAAFEPGVVFNQDPRGGVKVDPGSTVLLDVSRGNATIPLRSVIGSPVDE